MTTRTLHIKGLRVFKHLSSVPKGCSSRSSYLFFLHHWNKKEFFFLLSQWWGERKFHWFFYFVVTMHERMKYLALLIFYVLLVWCVKEGKQTLLIFLFCCCNAWRNKGEPFFLLLLFGWAKEWKKSFVHFFGCDAWNNERKPHWFFCFVVATIVLLLQWCTKEFNYHVFHFANWASLCIIKL